MSGFELDLDHVVIFSAVDAPEAMALEALGLAWLHTQKSGLLPSVGEDAEHVAVSIAQRAQTPGRAHLH